MELVERLREGLDSEPRAGRPAGIEFERVLRPAAGLTIAPPSYEGELEIHKRQIDGGEVRDAIELDSVGSSANRLEDALAALLRAGDYPLPVATVTIEAGEHQDSITLSTLELPHRSFDGWLRLAENEEGTRFEDSEAGRDLTLAHPGNLDALLETSAHDLLLGAWDSHRKGPHGQVRLARCLSTSLIGLDPSRYTPVAGRRDPLNLGADSELPKGAKKLSEQGLSSIPPQRSREKVSISEARFLGFLSFPALRRLGFKDYDATDVRVLLALLGIYAVLLRDAEGWDIRSGAALIPTGDLEMALVGTTPDRETFSLGLDQARELLDSAAERVGIRDRKVQVEAGKTLNDYVAKAIAQSKG